MQPEPRGLACRAKRTGASIDAYYTLTCILQPRSATARYASKVLFPPCLAEPKATKGHSQEPPICEPHGFTQSMCRAEYGTHCIVPRQHTTVAAGNCNPFRWCGHLARHSMLTSGNRLGRLNKNCAQFLK